MSRLLDQTVPTGGNEPRAKDDALARELRGFGPVALLAFVLIYLGNSLFAPLSALLVLLWAWRSRTPWRDIGFGRPHSWVVAILGGLLFGIAFKLLMKTLVMPLLGAPPANAAFSYLIGNTAALPAAIYLMVVTAGFGEETFFRGFLFERLGRLLGAAPARKAAIVAVTALWFGLEHIAVQGLAGFQQATIVGLAFGAIYAVIGRLWFLIAAHAAFDLTALAIIYLDLERVAASYFLG